MSNALHEMLDSRKKPLTVNIIQFLDYLYPDNYLVCVHDRAYHQSVDANNVIVDHLSSAVALTVLISESELCIDTRHRDNAT